MLTKAPRGTKDVLPSESYKWQYVENVFKDVCKNFGYKEIRTPVFEHTELFERGVGETTDVVQKEMYTFLDKGERSITLKPEGTSPVVRSYIENKLYADAQPIKAYYITPCFRYERPQAGRLREFHQFGVEVFGSQEASLDVEVMTLVSTFLKTLGLKNIDLHINSIGCPSCRENYNKILKEYLGSRLDELCETCKSRYEKNPMRILDCKNETCKEKTKDAPLMIDNLCDECSEHFEKVKEYLKLAEVDFVVDAKIVRGLDYYTKTAFEFISNDIGSQSTVSGGGRYDRLVEELGGVSTPAVGFGLGIERLLLTLENNGIEIPKQDSVDIYIVSIGENADKEAFKLLSKLRMNGISGDKDYLGRSIKAQFKYSDKINAKYTVVIGDDEIEKGIVSLKNMSTGEQKEVNIDSLAEELKK
ncbi:histidyl-tRNA synthetase HisS [Gottschalkia acidurici 9a]|uniref:Histidine--tRNA ligase n=1 Tax=Gottschalkia acidurici (strain ATCC 7906 / DSM 604 / BCRC 14475 / CIP 104303 / KCTC 5404 / NCIMB 10678 / 9a) TaxID=1128398 RepID=K0B0Y4_GOTA9|nr:histidine--tRNA ligase [Gottschalkia acidurici]AFS78737.1 histidyl-tRNA synthetase HisS [Gottschalkia acidurici 9a]